MIKLVALNILFILILPLVGLKAETNVVATIGMIADVVENVAKGSAQVQGLIGPGVDPHSYKATRSDIVKLSRADVVFYNGLLLEGKITDALIRVASSGRKVYAVTELIEPSYLLESEDYSGAYDPHVWMDPRAWSKAVEVVREKLSELNPKNKDSFRTAAEAYLSELAKLDAYAEKILKTVPKDSRVLVTAHDAFNYFGKRYGFEVLGIQGISTESEAGVHDIEQLVEVLVSRKIGAVFIESTVSKRNIRALIEGAKAKGHTVNIGGELFSDAMGKSGTYRGTYVGMIDHNVTTIARALGGDAPEEGLNGRL